MAGRDRAAGLGRDPEVEAILDEAREQAADRLIEALQTYEAAQAPDELRATIRAYSGFAEAASVEWLLRRTADPRADQDAARPRLPEHHQRRASGRERRTMNKTYVIGVGMTKFDKPGTKEGDYPDWAKEAGEKALADAGIPYDAIEQAYAGYVYGDSTYGQRAIYELGLTGIPVINVNNNCSTGSSALFLARQAVRGGLVDCALAVGFEKMERGSLGMKYTDRTPAMDKHMAQDVRAARPGGVAIRAADVRQRRPRPHAEVRLQARALRLDRLEEPQALGQQPVRPVPGRVHARGHRERADDPRAADQAAVLADLGRRRRGDRRL